MKKVNLDFINVLIAFQLFKEIGINMRLKNSNQAVQNSQNGANGHNGQADQNGRNGQASQNSQNDQDECRCVIVVGSTGTGKSSTIAKVTGHPVSS